MLRQTIKELAATGYTDWDLINEVIALDRLDKLQNKLNKMIKIDHKEFDISLSGILEKLAIKVLSERSQNMAEPEHNHEDDVRNQIEHDAYEAQRYEDSVFERAQDR